MVSGYHEIKRKGWIDKYDVRLKAICDNFNHINTTIPLSNERLIHTNKYVFYSSKPQNKRREMYSSLLAGRYIAPDTTYTTFRGIFEEIKFTQPVIWMGKLCSLIYFINMVFKEDNPYDLWVKCVYCFRLNDNKTLKRENLAASIITHMKTDTPYNIGLKRIAEKYNHDLNK